MARARLRASGLSRQASKKRMLVCASRSIVRCTRSRRTISKSRAETVAQLGVDGHEIVLVRHQQPVSGVEEHADLGALKGGGEVANFSLEPGLVEIEAFDDLEAELLQRGADVGRIVLRVLELGRVAIGGIADDEGDALLRRGDWRLPIRIGDPRSGWKKRSGEEERQRQNCDCGKPRASRREAASLDGGRRLAWRRPGCRALRRRARSCGRRRLSPPRSAKCRRRLYGIRERHDVTHARTLDAPRARLG